MATTTDQNRNTAFVATYGDEITVRAKDIKGLAIAYAQFMEAAIAGRLVDAKTWAERLDGVQKLTGVELLSDAILNDYLELPAERRQRLIDEAGRAASADLDNNRI